MRAVPRPIEEEGFPFEDFIAVAQRESYRKEINRPLSYLHKWWARRLGSVFRAVLVGALSPPGTDARKAFYAPTDFSGAVVCDPFMGSGITVMEALKLGCRVIGRDINPVACFMVINALQSLPRERIEREYQSIESDVASRISGLYEARTAAGERAQGLYYFWVKTAPCPACNAAVDLFGSYVFARHVNRKTHPHVQVLCPQCGGVIQAHHGCTEVCCGQCKHVFDPRDAPATRTHASCTRCRQRFSIAEALAGGKPPEHRLYAKLVLDSNGRKHYLPAEAFDRRLYDRARKELASLEKAGGLLVPSGALAAGRNTTQAMRYGYLRWRDMFNARQLLCLHWLGARIARIEDRPMRELFTCLWSGVLEFNNMFVSYKGEGTGAVRSVFSNHILKPERTPLEANVWGTPKSSGAFSTLYRRRVSAAFEYAKRPFEIALDQGGKTRRIHDLAGPLRPHHCESAEELIRRRQGVHLSCGSGGSLPVPDKTVDAVVTDPPFFDNVNYSELADFFYVWQRKALGNVCGYNKPSTRQTDEVQRADPMEYAARLAAVWKESHRILKDEGLLVFTFHHSRAEAWEALGESLRQSAFRVVCVHPIKSELALAVPKHRSKAPIDLDMIFVCRKADALPFSPVEDASGVVERSYRQAIRIAGVGHRLSAGDLAVIASAWALRSSMDQGMGFGEALALVPAQVAEVRRLLNEASDGGIRRGV